MLIIIIRKCSMKLFDFNYVTVWVNQNIALSCWGFAHVRSNICHFKFLFCQTLSMGARILLDKVKVMSMHRTITNFIIGRDKSCENHVINILISLIHSPTSTLIKNGSSNKVWQNKHLSVCQVFGKTSQNRCWTLLKNQKFYNYVAETESR